MLLRALTPFVIALAIALAIFYLPWLTGSRSFYLSDITYYFEPFLRLIGDNLRHGKFILWNPYSFCGMSQVAIPSPGLFYPPTWIFAVLPFNSAFAVNLIFHQLIAGIGNFALVFGLGWGLGPAWIAGLVAALSAYMFSLEANYTIMASAAWLPLTLWLLIRISGDFTWRNMLRVAFCSLSVALLILSGRPEISQPAILLLMVYVVTSFIVSLRVGGFRNQGQQAGFRSLALALGVALSAPALLPALEWKALSPRATGLAPVDIFRWSASWYDFICLILPQPLGDLHILGARFLSIAATRPGYIPYLASAFVGPVVITLAIWGAFDRKWRFGWLLCVVLIASMIMAAGNNTLIAPWFVSHIAFLNVFRYPVKLLFFPVWCLGIFAARGLNVLMEDRLSRVSQLVALIFWFVLAGCSAVVYFWHGLGNALISNPACAAMNLALMKSALKLIGQAGLIASLLGLVIVLLAWLTSHGKIKKTHFVAIVIPAMAASLMVHAVCFARHPAPKNFFSMESYLNQTLKSPTKRILPLYFDPLTRPQSFVVFREEERNASFYQYARQLLLPNTHMDCGIASSFGYEAAETSDYRRLFIDVFKKSHAWLGKTNLTSAQKTDLPLYRFCQITSTGFVLTQIQKSIAGKKVSVPLLDSRYFVKERDDVDWNVRLYKVKDTLPPIYFTYKWQVVDAQNQALSQIVDAGKNSFDPKLITLIERHAGVIPPLPQPQFMIAQLQKDLKFELRENTGDKIILVANTNIAGMLVLTNHYYPGWKATIDNKPVILMRANGVLTAMNVPAGTHVVELKYDPDSLRNGFLIASAAGLFLVLLLFAAGLRAGARTST